MSAAVPLEQPSSNQDKRAKGREVLGGHPCIGSVERDKIWDAPALPTRAGYQRARLGEQVESSSNAGRLGHLLSFYPRDIQIPQAAVLA